VIAVACGHSATVEGVGAVDLVVRRLRRRGRLAIGGPGRCRTDAGDRRRPTRDGTVATLDDVVAARNPTERIPEKTVIRVVSSGGSR
jgi:hypothetical protein